MCFNENYKPNSLGIIQMNSIDTKCAIHIVLHEMKDIMEEK